MTTGGMSTQGCQLLGIAWREKHRPRSARTNEWGTRPPIRRRSDYIIGFVTPAIGPNKSKKPTRPIVPTHNLRGKVWMEDSTQGFTNSNLLSVKPCMLFFIQTLPRVLCTGAISSVSFLNLFGPIAGVTNPIM